MSWAVVSPASCALAVTAARCDARSVHDVLAMTVADCHAFRVCVVESAAVCSPSCEISVTVTYCLGDVDVWATVSPVSGALAVTAAQRQTSLNIPFRVGRRFAVCWWQR